jgi:hypothetical protein
MSMAVTDGLGLPSVSVPLTVTVVANTAPVLTTSLVGNLLFTNNSAPKILDPLVTVADDSTTLKGATVTITGLLVGANDTLAFTQPVGSSITGSFNTATKVLTLTGTGTVVQYQAALRSVTFATSGLINTGLRTVSFVVTDLQDAQSLSLPLAVLVI